MCDIFRNNKSQKYKELSNNKEAGRNNIPNFDEAMEFWSGIWSMDKQDNVKASLLGDANSRFSERWQRENIAITLCDVKFGIQSWRSVRHLIRMR